MARPWGKMEYLGTSVAALPCSLDTQKAESIFLPCLGVPQVLSEVWLLSLWKNHSPAPQSFLRPICFIRSYLGKHSLREDMVLHDSVTFFPSRKPPFMNKTWATFKNLAVVLGDCILTSSLKEEDRHCMFQLRIGNRAIHILYGFIRCEEMQELFYGLLTLPWL